MKIVRTFATDFISGDGLADGAGAGVFAISMAARIASDTPASFNATRSLAEREN